MLQDIGGSPVYTDPCSPGGGGSDPGTGTGLVVPGDLSQILSDPAIMGAATPAARTSFEISVFDQILHNMWWKDSFPVLDSFYLANETAFIGEIAQLYSDIRAYTDQVDVQLTSVENDLATIDLLGQQMDSLGGLLVIETDPGTITQLNQQILTLMSQKDAIEQGVTNSQSQYDSQNQISLGSFVNQLNGVSTSQAWESDEKEVIRLHLEAMRGNGLLPGDLSFLRSLASTCWRDGGRGVYLAQALLLSTTGEYYNQGLCAPATGALLSTEEVGPSGWSFSLLPNPAKEYVEVQFIGDRNEGEIDLLIHDMKGHQVYAQPSMGGSIRIETIHLVPGVYFARLTQQGESAVKPLIIVK
jgi:hypothetical protein